MSIAIGGLVRDRVPELRVYLRHLATIRWPAPRFVFVLDNCRPETEALVADSFPEARLARVADGAKPYQREVRKAYDHMAALRDRLSDEARRVSAVGLLSVDSDVVATPDLAVRLVEASRPYVAALVDNSRGKGDAYNVLWEREGKLYRRPFDRARPGQADVVGAACYYRRDLLDRVRFSGPLAATLGEDASFGIGAKAAGVGGWYVPLELEHLMLREQTAAHVVRCALCRAAEMAA